jgi:hypothetical protein
MIFKLPQFIDFKELFRNQYVSAPISGSTQP